jgi:DNA-binding response OmpR family regulator
MSAANNKAQKILIVEDEAMMREIVARKLLSKGFNVVTASAGKEALATWLKEKPDLVLLDLILPEMDGFTILKNIRGQKDSKVANTSVIVLSNLWSNEDILKAENLKIQGYLVKAYFTTDDILEKVNQVLSRKA